MDGVGSGAESKVGLQRKSADNLLDEPRQLTAELGAKKKPQQSNKPFNANHWLIQEAEMRRQLEAQNIGYTGQTFSQLMKPVAVGYAGHNASSAGGVSRGLTHTNQPATSTANSMLLHSGPISNRVNPNVNNISVASENAAPTVAGVGSVPVMPAVSGPQRKTAVSQNGPSPTNMVTPAMSDSVPELGISGK
ncbi:LIM and calponin homology domains-containing protein 1-like [Tropilaelaps mercedesae]|uniref:LIM and calponin homology domains-containing protein 1-like n=1 Tax=Tropilaelaps mercedesae TaxID=418985 RepID=A0A1V9Y1B4_9ACAR|nr:LIM and calponin homology domains-containing protein 1-like [Tropilaelaps mercedesae]